MTTRLAGLLLVGLVAGVAGAVVWMEANEYAGMDQKYVRDEAASALDAHYEAAEVIEAYWGPNDQPDLPPSGACNTVACPSLELRDKLRVVERAKAQFAGHEAWKVRYLAARKTGDEYEVHGEVCVFVWGEPPVVDDRNWAVTENANCTSGEGARRLTRRR